MSGTRAQSEVVGMVLMVAVAVVLTTVIGSSFVSQASEAGPMVELSVRVTPENVTVTHETGEPVPLAQLEIVAHNQSATWNRSFTNGTLVPPDDRLDAGDQWNTSSPFPRGERVTVYVVHQPTNTLLFEGRRIVENAST